LNSKYTSLIRKGKLLYEQPQRSIFVEIRNAGACNLDLWVDTSIYPLDPETRKKPRFKDTKSLLEFVGNGCSGLLGYCKNLENSVLEIQRLKSELQQQEQKREFDLFRSSLLQREREMQSQYDTELHALRLEIQLLQDESSFHQRQCNNLNQELLSRQRELSESVKTKKDLAAQLKDIQRGHRSELQFLQAEFQNTKNILNKLQKKYGRMKLTPYAYRTQIRARKDLQNISQSGGHTKAQHRLARLIIAPATVKRIQEENAANHTRKRLHGSKESQKESGLLMGNIWSKIELLSMLKSPTMQSVGIDITDQYLDKIRQEVGAHEILACCDRNGVIQNGFNAIYKSFQNGVKAAGKGIHIGCLSKPYHLSLLHTELNSKFVEFIGEYYSINDCISIPHQHSKSKEKSPMLLKLDETNNLFVDIEIVQRTMVQLYKITPEGIQLNCHSDNNFILCMKLDKV
jgi:hypothetical protein